MNSDSALIVPVSMDLKVDSRGRLEILEFPNLIFLPKRIYFLSKVPAGSKRGEHGHKSLRQIFFALNGTFTLLVTDGKKQVSVCLESGGPGYYLKEGLWRSLSDFSGDAICVVIASENYNQEDYIYDYTEYLTWKSLND